MSANPLVPRHRSVKLSKATQKFGAMAQSRMRYALTEKDDATGLDHTWWRKYDNSAGRWTSPDQLGGSVGNPQSFNRYSYVGNDPVNAIDPSGLMPCIGAECSWGSVSAGFWGSGYLGGTGWGDVPHPGEREIGSTQFSFSIYLPGIDTIRFWTWAPYPELVSDITANLWIGLIPQEPVPQQQPDPCANPRDSSDGYPPIIPYVQSSVAQDFLDALLEINQAVPGGIGFTEVFRTRAHQQELWNNRANNPNPVARPGTSRHEGGFAFDVPGMATRDRRGQLVQTPLGRTVIPIFANHGFAWGGAFNDPPHFQADPTLHGYANSAAAATAANDYYERCIRGR